jgi:hypothetical protein
MALKKKLADWHRQPNTAYTRLVGLQLTCTATNARFAKQIGRKCRCVRVFKHFVWFEAGSDKMAF